MIKKLAERYHKIPLPARAAAWFAVCNAVQSGCKFLAGPLLIRILTTEQYGTYSVYLSWVNLISIFATMNMNAGVFNNAMFKFSDRRSEYTSAIQTLSMLLTLGTLAVYILGREFWDGLFGLEQKVTLMIFVQLFFSESFLLWSSRQRFEYRYVHLLIYTALLSVLYMVLPVAAALVFPPEQRLMAVIYTGVAIQAGFGLCFMVYNYARGRTLYEGKFWRFAFFFNLPLLPHYISGNILSQSDRVMIQRYIGASEAGIYSFTYSISMGVSVITGAINNAIVPYTYRKLQEQDYKNLSRVANVIMLLVGGMMLALSIVAPEFIRFFATEDYYDAIDLVPVIALSSYYTFLYSLSANVEFYFEANKFIAVASAIGAVLNVALNYLLLPVFGYKAAAYTTLFCYVMFALAHYVFMRVVCRKRKVKGRVYAGRALLAISAVVSAASLGVMALYDMPFLRYGILCVAIALCVFKRRVIMRYIKEVRGIRI